MHSRRQKVYQTLVIGKKDKRKTTHRPELWIACIGWHTITPSVCEPMLSMYWVGKYPCGVGEELDLSQAMNAPDLPTPLTSLKIKP